MKILFCSQEKFLPLAIGGSYGNLKIINNMVQRGHEVTVATPFYMNKKPFEKQYKVKLASFSPFYIDRYIPMRERKYIFYAFLYLFHLIKLLLSDKYDAAFVRNCVLAGPCFLVKKFCKIPFFLSMTDFLSDYSYQNPMAPKIIVDILFKIERFLGNQFERTFVITPLMKAELEKYKCANDRIIVNYDGVDVDIFDLAKIDSLTLERTYNELGFKENIVLYHGNIQLDAVNHFESIINATLKKLDVHFVIIGMGEGYSVLQARLKDNRNVRFMGFVKHDDLPRFIAASNVGMIPYKRTFNSNIILTLKLLEYLAMGLPVVSANLASIKDVFGKFSCVKIADDNDSFSNHILECLKMGRSQEAMQFVRQNFSWDIVTVKMIEEIESFVKKKR